MKITKLTLENFKGIGKKVEIPLSEITLLFGKNSAGKSTILHAMLYTQELLENLNVNADVLSGAGDGLDLGGFESFIHRGAGHEGITIRYDLDFSEVDWLKEFPVHEYIVDFNGREIDLSERGSDVSSGWLELNIGYGGDPVDALIIRKCEIGLDGVWLLLTTTAMNRFLLEQYDMSLPMELINEAHPLLALPGEEDEPKTGNLLGFLHESLRTPFYNLYFSEEAVPGPLSEDKIEEIFGVDLEGCQRDGMIREGLDSVDLSGVSIKVVPLYGGIFEVALLDKGRGKEIVILHDWFPKISFEKVDIRGLSENEKNDSDNILPFEFLYKRCLFDIVWELLADYYNYDYEIPIKKSPRKSELDEVANPDFSKFDQIKFKIKSVGDIEDDNHYKTDGAIAEFLRQLFARFAYGPIQLLRQELNKLRYIGPIRHIPSRAYNEQLSPSQGRWAKGLAAWDALFYDEKLCSKVSDAMKRHLNLRYSIQRKEYIELELDSEVMSSLKLLAAQYEEQNEEFLKSQILDPLDDLPKLRHVFLQDEKNGIKLKPHDVGVGLSQVIPVVVGAYAKDSSLEKGGIFAVEQPELHVHPAVEVGLGDVFIEANRESGRMMLIETHSEHLLLRLLRRVRESADQPNLELVKEDLSVLYVVAGENGVEINHIPVTDDGDFDAPWPEGFFDERAEELF